MKKVTEDKRNYHRILIKDKNGSLYYMSSVDGDKWYAGQRPENIKPDLRKIGIEVFNKKWEPKGWKFFKEQKVIIKTKTEVTDL